MPSFACRLAHEGHCVSSGTDWYFSKQNYPFEIPFPSTKAQRAIMCSGAQSTRQKAYARDTSCMNLPCRQKLPSDCPEHSPKGICLRYFLPLPWSLAKRHMLGILLAIALSTRQKAYALDTSCHCPEHSPKGVCSRYFLPKGTKFHLIALSTHHKAC